MPTDPPKVGKQTLYYFIGLQDEGQSLNILQPVLAWCSPGSACEDTPKWSISSWACCPQNITFRSTPVLGLRANDTVDVSINRTGAFTWSIDAHWQGQNTTLNAAIGNYFYNYADVTLEVRAANMFIDRPFSVGGRNAASSDAQVVVLPMCPVQVYSVLDCDELAPPMRFSKLALHDQSGLMKSPAWQRTEGRACSGKVTLNKETGDVTVK